MRFKRSVSLALASLLAAAGVACDRGPGVLRVSASLDSQKSDLEDQREQIDEDLAEIDRQLAETENSIAEQEEYQQALSQQISLNLDKKSVLEQELSNLNAQMEESEAELSQIQEDIASTETEIQATSDKYKERMRAMYMMSDMSALELLFEASSFSDFLTNLEMMKAISQHDTALLETLRGQVETLESEQEAARQVQEDISARQTDIAAQQQELDATNQQLQAAYAESESATQDLEKERENFEANKEQRLQEAEEIDAEINDLLARIAEENRRREEELKKQQESQNGSSSSSSSGGSASSGGTGIVTEAGFLWPLPGFSNINSAYGWRFGGSDFHTGLDIGGSGVYGADIVAAKSGVVSSPMTHWSYGNNVVINHGDGYVTLYAHCSELLVSPGETVTQGQVIARVGATGNVTGPHLHFEVYYNGVRQDPASYIQY